MDDRAVLDGNLLAEHHVGLDHHVLAELGVGAEKHRLRRNERDAGLERRLAQALLRYGFRFGELGFGVDAAHVVLLDFDRHGVELHAAGDLDRIGQIKFAFAIVVADPLQDRQRMSSGERHQPAVAEIDRALAGACIGFLADSDEFAVGDDEPAVAERVGSAESEHGERRARGQRRAQARQRRRPHERRVAVDDEDVIGLKARDGRLGRQRRVRRSALLVLHKGSARAAARAALGGDGLLPGTNDDCGVGDAGFGDGGKHMGDQRAPGDGMQDLGNGRAHAGALAGREHDRQTSPSLHRATPRALS